MCSSAGFREQPAAGSRQSEESLWIQNSVPCQASVSDYKSTSYIIQYVYCALIHIFLYSFYRDNCKVNVWGTEDFHNNRKRHHNMALHHLNLNNCQQMLLYYTKLICKDDEPPWTIMPPIIVWKVVHSTYRDILTYFHSKVKYTNNNNKVWWWLKQRLLK